jgi:hypothetical protein
MHVATTQGTLDLSGDAQSTPFPVFYRDKYSVQVNTTGGVGSLKLQSSNSIASKAADVPSTSWVDIDGSTVAVSGADNIMFNVADCAYRWVRVVYTSTSGSGTGAVTFHGKGC